jgi:hypothetical protein
LLITGVTIIAIGTEDPWQILLPLPELVLKIFIMTVSVDATVRADFCLRDISFDCNTTLIVETAKFLIQLV